MSHSPLHVHRQPSWGYSVIGQISSKFCFCCNSRVVKFFNTHTHAYTEKDKHTHKQSNSHKYEHEPKQNEHNRFFRYVSLCFVPHSLPVTIIITTTTGSYSHNRPDGFAFIVVSVSAVGYRSRPPVTCLWYVINTNKHEHTHTRNCNCTSLCTHTHTNSYTHATLIVYAFTMEIQFDTLFVFLFCFQLERESLYALFRRRWFTFVFTPSRRLHANRIASRIKYTAPTPMPLFPVIVVCFTCICGV